MISWSRGVTELIPTMTDSHHGGFSSVMIMVADDVDASLRVKGEDTRSVLISQADGGLAGMSRFGNYTVIGISYAIKCVVQALPVDLSYWWY